MLIMILATMLQAVGPVVGNASFIEWDLYSADVITEIRVYCSNTPDVGARIAVPSGTPTDTVGPAETQWPIQNLTGQQYCVVTAFNLGDGVESRASNEVSFFVRPPPDNLRVVVP